MRNEEQCTDEQAENGVSSTVGERAIPRHGGGRGRGSFGIGEGGVERDECIKKKEEATEAETEGGGGGGKRREAWMLGSFTTGKSFDWLVGLESNEWGIAKKGSKLCPDGAGGGKALASQSWPTLLSVLAAALYCEPENALSS